MGDERVRWGRKYLKFTPIALLIITAACFAAQFVNGMNWIQQKALKHWVSSDIYKGEVSTILNLFSEMIPASPRKSFYQWFFSRF